MQSLRQAFLSVAIEARMRCCTKLLKAAALLTGAALPLNKLPDPSERSTAGRRRRRRQQRRPQ
jgi:hypothetical protein